VVRSDRLRWWLPCIAFAVAGIGGSASAATIVARFEGRVIGGSFEVPPELEGLIEVGSPVSGTFRYVTAPHDADSSPTRGAYFQPPGLGIELTLGGASIATDPAGEEFFVQVLDERPIFDGYVDELWLISRFSNTALSPASVAPNQLHIFFAPVAYDIGSDALAEFTQALLDGTLNVGAGQVATTFEQLPRVFINFRVDSVTLVAIPEPSSLLLVGSGVALLGRRRWCRLTTSRSIAPRGL
jgi:hypothetical protein